MDGIHPLHSTSLLQKKQFFKNNLGKFLKYITFSSCSLIIFESLPKLYLENCFFSINCQNGGGEFHPRSGSTARGISERHRKSSTLELLCAAPTPLSGGVELWFPAQL